MLALLALALVGAASALERRARLRAEADLERSRAALEERVRSTKLILDAVEHGFVVIDCNGTMRSEVPAIMESWLGAAPASANLSHYLGRQNSTFAESLTLGLEQVAEQLMTTEEAIAQLPSRLTLGTRIVSLAYRPLDQPGQPAQPWLLVTLSDMSLQLERESGAAAQRDLLNIFRMIQKDRQSVINFLHEGSMVVEELRSTFRSDLPLTKRLVHTLKGNAAQFGMSVVANACHEFEALLCRRPNTKEFAALTTTWHTAVAEVSTLVAGAGNELTIDTASYHHLVELVREGRPHAQLLAAIGDWGRDPVHARLEGLRSFAETLAGQLGKQGLKATCEGNGHRLEYTEWASFWTACVHVIRNAVDHGIEDAVLRLKQGKSATGHLDLRAEISDQHFTVTIADDGRGINWAKLAAKAEEAELPFETDADRLEVLFCDGLSSKTMVSSISGRGIGLSAFRAEVLRRNGSVEVTTVPGAGTTFTARFPLASCMVLANAS